MPVQAVEVRDGGGAGHSHCQALCLGRGDLPYPGTATHGERRTVAEAESESVGLKAPWVEAWGMIVIVVFWDGRV